MTYSSILLTCVVSVVAQGATLPVTPTQTPAAPAPAPISPARTTDLFGGKDLAGWAYIAGTPGDISQVASVKEGVITVIGKPNGYLATVAAYKNYALHAEWRWIDLTPNPSTNGGILLNVSSGPVQQNLWPTSLQAQLKVQRAGDLLTMGAAKCAETPMPPALPNAPSSTLLRHKDASEKPLGEWNGVDITVSDGVIEVAINGVVQNRATQCVPSSGRIGLQLEGYPFELRNVRVSPLPALAR